MGYEKKIFQEIRSEVQKIVPDAKVLLFGSRANGDASEESDWDILILTSDKPDHEIKKIIHDKLFPLSVKIAAFINTILVSEDDWNKDSSYYALRQSVSTKKVVA